MMDNADDNAGADLPGGNQGCKCIDASDDIASLDDHTCVMVDGETKGVLTALGGPCIPPTYGSHTCLRHDININDPACWPVDSASPAYCFMPWCFVDEKTCSRDSEELIFRSSYFPADSGVDLFYSYSTCNSTADHWIDRTRWDVMGGVSIKVAVPTYEYPYLYKIDPQTSEVIYSEGDEYFDDTIPFAGMYVDYVNEIVELSRGDISKVSFTHRSRGSSKVHPESRFTASVRDIKSGLVDMAVGPFWVTSERLKMTAFTVPIKEEETVLVTVRPSNGNGWRYQATKVWKPFSHQLWFFITLLIVSSALLSVWFSDKRFDSKSGKVKQNRRNRRKDKGRRLMENILGSAADATIGNLTDRKKQRRAAVYTRLCLDSFLQEGTFFCGGGVEQDQGASLPKKLLMFGFAFFILIANSAYVANLATFLTLSQLSGSVHSMEEATAKGMTVCAHPALMSDLVIRWPKANFIFSDDLGADYRGLLIDFDAGKCEIMAVGRDATLYKTLMEMFCDRNLAFTNAIVLKIPLAFPINSDLAAGFSYWMVEGEKNPNNSIQNKMKKFHLDISRCSIEIDVVEDTGNENNQITSKNMFLPFTFYLAFVVAAIITQFVTTVKANKTDDKNASLTGRTSTLNQWINKSVRLPKHNNASSKSNDILDDLEKSRMTAGRDNFADLETIEESPDTFTKNNSLVSTSPAIKRNTSSDVDCASSSSKELGLNDFPGVNLTSTKNMFHAMNFDAPATEKNSPSTKTEMKKRLQRFGKHSSVLDEFIDLIQEIKREIQDEEE